MKFETEADRWGHVSSLKSDGLSNSKIAKIIGVSPDRIRQLIAKHGKQIKQECGWSAGLKRITANLLERNGYQSRKEVYLSFKTKQLMKDARIGPATYNEIATWLGEPEKEIYKAPPDYTVETAIKFLNKQGYEVKKRERSKST